MQVYSLPDLPCDYLRYQNRKGEFFDAMRNLWNWNAIEARYAAATVEIKAA